MQVNQAIGNVFSQLQEVLAKLSKEQYIQPSRILCKATIGQHVRHVIELFLCLDQGYETGTVNYEKRKRDYRIETDIEIARSLMYRILAQIGKPNKFLLLEGGYDDHSDTIIAIETNYFRELVYNLEHTVHHMALIRVGINEVSSIIVPDTFGVASSTIKYREACAQ
jgi:hypothetical protein